jgi:flagellar hook-associated protein 1 FlgK
VSNLLTSLLSSANALTVFDRALSVMQNNVTNASTPGYARQRILVEAAPFEPNEGLIGGVRAGEVESSRNLYAEQSVRRQVESLGYYEQLAQSLSSIESVFDISGDAGIPGALSALFDSFSAWALDPASTTARQAVLDEAAAVAGAFQEMAADLARVTTDTDLQLRQTVDSINALGEKLQSYNAAIRKGATKDAGLDTGIQNALEELSELVNVTSIYQDDGTVMVLIGGQTPLLVGENLYKISVSVALPSGATPVYSSAQAPARILNSIGQDITSLISQGQLGGLLKTRNEVLPSLGGDAYHAGDINVLAKAVVSRINELFTSGLVSEGPPPVYGQALFDYSTASDANVANTLTVSSTITAAGLAARSAGPPAVANGTALALAALADPQADADKVNGFSFVEYYGETAARVGRLLADAQENEDFKTQMAAQARSLRTEISGVSLDEEAILLIQYQRAYQANAKMISVLSDLTEVAINLI